MYLKNQEQLDSFCTSAKNHGILSIDLEFIPENSYFPKLALVQLAYNNNLKLFDPLEPINLQPLFELVSDKGVIKVVHSGYQDMGILYHLGQKLPSMVFDTQVAAGFLGMGHQLSYSKMAQKLLNKTISKEQTYTDWLRRPLSKAQELYALDDVAYLEDSYKLLLEMLEKENKLSWVSEDLQCYEKDSFYKTNLDLVYKKVKKNRALDKKETRLLTLLAKMREKIAIEKDAPRKHLISDDVLMDIVNKCPFSSNEFKRIRGYERIKPYEDYFLKELKKFQPIYNAINDESPEFIKGTLPEAQDFLFFCFKKICSKLDIAPALAANRDEVEKLFHLKNQNDHPLLQGWRKKVIGEPLLAFIKGQTKVGLDSKTKEVLFINK